MIEVKIIGTDGEYLWVGHGVGPTAVDARRQGEKRMPEGYRFVESEVTRDDVDEKRIHREWVYGNPARRVVLRGDE